MITLLDYGAGNVRSVINALEHLGESLRLVHRPEDILHAETLVFPGQKFNDVHKFFHGRGRT